MKRPAAQVLSSRSLVPARNLIDPAPNRFSHALARAQPFFWSPPGSGEGDEPAGTFAAGHRVLLIRDEPEGYARVADADGLYVLTALDGLTAVSR